MPCIGLGTYQMSGDACTAAVCCALRTGYRHIDTASVYRNEDAVAKGIADSGVPRSDIFITTKLQPKDHGAGAYDACIASLARLKTGYVDLLLVHWPGVAGRRLDDPAIKDVRKESWLALQRLHKEGKARAIGVSNYMPHHLEELCTAPWCEVQPAVNQFELHPLLQQADAVVACRKYGVVVEAYSSLARGAPALLTSEAATRIAAAHAGTVPQVCLAWALAKGFVVIPKSTDPARIAENFGAAALASKLTPEDIASLDALEAAAGSLRTCWDPTTVKV